MKKLFAALFAVLAVAGTADAKTLVAYYSRSGNTAAVANQIVAATGADVYRIETADPNHYPAEYQPTTVQAQQEINDGILPEINTIPDLTEYDTVFVGTPCWWGTMASPVRTFLTNADLAGKNVIPFNTHEGSGAGSVHTDIAALTPNSEHLNGIAIRGSASANSTDTINAWLTEIGIIE